MRAAPPGLVDMLRRLPICDAAKRSLRRRLAEPQRHYHGAAHVALLWRRHRRLAAGSVLVRPRWDRLIACVIAFHDAVYDARRPDNEAASAALWRRSAARLTLQDRRWVEHTILATADHLAPDAAPPRRGPARLARAWTLDLDLTPLAETTAEFEANTRRLRREFAHLSTTEWDAGRLAFLRRMSAEPCVFRTRKAVARFCCRVRANLTRSLHGG